MTTTHAPAESRFVPVYALRVNGDGTRHQGTIEGRAEVKPDRSIELRVGGALYFIPPTALVPFYEIEASAEVARLRYELGKFCKDFYRRARRAERAVSRVVQRRQSEKP